MSTEEPPSSTTATSALDKPLHLLTEDDISQLTREDCRRFLKQKGMRRPSWNKSQAIQQVIMLKALLEPSPDTDDGGRKPYITSRQQQTLATRDQKGTSADTEISLSAEESVAGHRSNDTEKGDVLGDNDSAAPTGIVGGIEEKKGQMTIFYSGKVNVYDDVPADKAQALFQLAASPLQFSQEDALDGKTLQSPSTNAGRDFPSVLSPVLQTVRMTDNYRLHKEENHISREDNSGEGSASRKASVQRYLEKKKDRFKSKRKAGATLDVYTNHQIGNHTNPHEPFSRSATCSPPPVRPPNTPNRFN
ncbi:putative transcription factor TIFY family [Helianthus debilis subsp. tardiflorus]